MDKTEELIRNLVSAYKDVSQFAVLLKKWDIFTDLIEETLEDATRIQECFNPSDYVIHTEILTQLREAWLNLLDWKQSKKVYPDDTE